MQQVCPHDERGRYKLLPNAGKSVYDVYIHSEGMGLLLQELKIKYRGQANFIHVDLFDNLEKLQGDLSSARLSATVV